jgi:hypothetical protein
LGTLVEDAPPETAGLFRFGIGSGHGYFATAANDAEKLKANFAE